MKPRSFGTLGWFFGLFPLVACSAPVTEEPPPAALDESAARSTASVGGASTGHTVPATSSNDGGFGDGGSCQVDGGAACTLDCTVADCQPTCAPVSTSSCSLQCDGNGCSYTCPTMCGCAADLKPTCTKTCNDCQTLCQQPNCTLDCVEVCDANGCKPVCEPVCAPPQCATVCGSTTCGQMQQVLETPPQCAVHCSTAIECVYGDLISSEEKMVACRETGNDSTTPFATAFRPTCEVTCDTPSNVVPDAQAFCATTCDPPDCTVTCDPPSFNGAAYDPPTNCVTTCAPSKCHVEDCRQN